MIGAVSLPVLFPVFNLSSPRPGSLGIVAPPVLAMVCFHVCPLSVGLPNASFCCLLSWSLGLVHVRCLTRLEYVWALRFDSFNLVLRSEPRLSHPEGLRARGEGICRTARRAWGPNNPLIFIWFEEGFDLGLERA